MGLAPARDGLDVSHNGYHRHGAYLTENADMPGFSREEQRLLARLIGGHRRKLTLEGLEELVPPWDRSAVYLIVLLRLAVLLHRGRSPAALPDIQLTAKPRSLEVKFPARWLRDHPLTVADLQQEIDHLTAARPAAAGVQYGARLKSALRRRHRPRSAPATASARTPAGQIPASART